LREIPLEVARAEKGETDSLLGCDKVALQYHQAVQCPLETRGGCS
jgi:hypothetical protein